MALREGDGEHPPLSATSAGRTVVAVRGFHKFAVRDGLAATDPSAGVRPPAPAKRLPKAIPLGDVERLLDAAGAPGTALALRDRALLEVLYGTGARISEAVGLDVDDLELDEDPARQHRAAARQGLQGADRAGRELRRARRCRPTWSVAVRSCSRPARAATEPRGAMFLNARGGRLSRQSAWAVIVKAAERAGHHRRGVAAHPAALLRDPPARGRRRRARGAGAARHASVTTTQVYTLVTVDSLREVYAAAHPRALG